MWIWFPVWRGLVQFVGISGEGERRTRQSVLGCEIISKSRGLLLSTSHDSGMSWALWGDICRAAAWVSGGAEGGRGHELQEVKGKACTYSAGLGPEKRNGSRNFSSRRKKKRPNEVERSILWSCMCARLFHFKEGNPIIIKLFVLVF